mmetsp:Transcript_1069/g.4420  ORF Transcript_1069/g.4420 Transcript_1069/m.4420 type:complete len:1047 (+) Transcript_1069:230-3370(+)|eukprot:CAMPEP_0203926352 /NCGR_PEP_ID=MMETSP0359-20131031/65874_1 /ASSEMBLY_ACC=CAM_ASM_000338 /TAXON_ID=268821 /ORGANISM="Scrippsiella Hangoei, Strain SHTV-5" /LENGTH=1046 /DNA_ID=CAMNT_0050854937 /DNA_START=197 /DNA_END=3337 /DNA_ORIENTATION=+
MAEITYAHVVVKDRPEEGMLSKGEIQVILDKSSNPGIALPLEAKFWSREQLEMFVMSDGLIRPKGCSLLDERNMLNTNMSSDEVAHSLAQAAAWLADSDALLVGSGAGMGVDSGLGTFRGGHQGVWEGLQAVGLAYEEICDPRWFQEEPHLAWAFWHHCYTVYQDSTPHVGYSRIRELGERCPLGFFSFTSNIDSHWTTSGVSSDRVLEVHGAVRWLQCSKPCCPDVWKAPKDLGLTALPTHRVAGVLPTCPKCKAIARPNVQMFGGDAGFSKARRAAQFGKYDAWLKQLEARSDKDSLRVTCLEVGCGLTVPTVRRELEGILSKFPQARLIRINLENPGLSATLVTRGASLPMRAAPAIEELCQLANGSRASNPDSRFILWGRQGAMELEAPLGTKLGRLLRIAERNDEGIAVSFAGNAQACCNSGAEPQPLRLDDVVRRSSFMKTKVPGSAEFRLTATLDVEATFLDASGTMCGNAALKHRVVEVMEMLDDVNTRFAEPLYQRSVHACTDRQSIVRLVRSVQFEVLPKYGIEASDLGILYMTQMTNIVQRIPEVSEKAGKSMQLSRMDDAARLPSTPGPISALPPPPAAAPAARASAQSAPDNDSVRIELRAHADESSGDYFCTSVQAGSTIGDLRRQLVVELGWDDAAVSVAEFFLDPLVSPGAPMQDSDLPPRALLLRGAPLHKAPEIVQVTFANLPSEDGSDDSIDTVRLALPTDCCFVDVRSRLGDELGWDDRTRRAAKFLFKLEGGNYCCLRDQERIKSRRSIFVHGASLPRKGLSSQQQPSSPCSGAAPVSEAPRAEKRVPLGSAPPSAAPSEAEVTATIIQARRAAATAAASEKAGTWTAWPNHDGPGADLENMPANNLEFVKRRAELIGCVGFSVWQGKAYLKRNPRTLRKEDLSFKGEATPVAFHIFAPPPGAAAAAPLARGGGPSLSLARVLALQVELLEVFARPAFQRRLSDLYEAEHRQPTSSQQDVRLELLLSTQRSVLPRYGFEASWHGVQQLMGLMDSAPALKASADVLRNGFIIDWLVRGKFEKVTAA